ncbi:hypothetical protein NDU88_009886 [Pleurodeles waltl]|uniref:Uncharacterized protein n=1 Tax=Pleurodeles waltl TaxID=8319 RepID=A0AAV7PTQ6_PLEWA|nr:hypothetical protein NDU88_009886 [Pleurodeles waltl]
MRPHPTRCTSRSPGFLMSKHQGRCLLVPRGRVRKRTLPQGHGCSVLAPVPLFCGALGAPRTARLRRAEIHQKPGRSSDLGGWVTVVKVFQKSA